MSDCITVSCPEGYYCTTHKCYTKLGGCPWQRLDEIEIRSRAAIDKYSESGLIADLNGRIVELERHLAERQWISVEDRLPEPYTMVYVWPRPDFGVTQYAGYLSRRKGEKAFQWFSDTYETGYGIEENTVRVTHWLPLPEPPQE